MDARTGELYESPEAAREAGVPEEDVVELIGDELTVKDLARLVADARARERQATGAQGNRGTAAVSRPLRPAQGRRHQGRRR